MESAALMNPETGKPNPASLKELATMDRHELRSFAKGMTKGESFDFQIAYAVAQTALPIGQKVEYARARLGKIQSRENKSIPDKFELWQAKQYLKSVESRQQRQQNGAKQKEVSFPKWIKEKKSPYLIASVQMK